MTTFFPIHRPTSFNRCKPAQHPADPSAASCAQAANMITKFMTEISVRFNPFSACAKPARLFLTYLPADIRANGTSVTTTLLPLNSTEPSSLKVKFSMWTSPLSTMPRAVAHAHQRTVSNSTLTAAGSTSRACSLKSSGILASCRRRRISQIKHHRHRPGSTHGRRFTECISTMRHMGQPCMMLHSTKQPNVLHTTRASLGAPWR